MIRSMVSIVLGPPAFMYRPSAANIPASPLVGRHWQDVTSVKLSYSTPSPPVPAIAGSLEDILK